MHEIAARGAAGEFERDVALRELIEWQYERQRPPSEPFQWLNGCGAPLVRGQLQEPDRPRKACWVPHQ